MRGNKFLDRFECWKCGGPAVRFARSYLIARDLILCFFSNRLLKLDDEHYRTHVELNGLTDNMRDAVVKRRKISKSTTEPKNANTEAQADDSNDLLRKFFESRFQPLDLSTNSTSQISDEDEEDDESGEDFDGFSDNGSESEEEEVMVVEHVDARKEDVMLDKQTRKALLVCVVCLAAALMYRN